MTVYNVTVEEIRNVVTTSASTPNTIYVKIIASAGGGGGGGGSTLLTGSAAPNTATGIDGNWYVQKMSNGHGRFWGPKASSVWPSEYVSLTEATRHTHTQGSAATTWTITHTLGGRPSVTVVDSTGTTVVGDVQYNSDTQVTVTFSAAFSGSAYLT
jgi:uncharacterized protein YndB with AHSA1/START domain